MTIRRALDAMLSGEADGDVGAPGASTVRDALDGAGFGDVPADLVGTAIGHYADSAALEQADALAPLATEASSVPFDPELDAPVGDDDVHDVDPMDDLDAAAVVEPASDEAAEEVADETAVDEDQVDEDQEDATGFGAGSNDEPGSSLDEPAEPTSGLDDGFADTLRTSLDDPASLDDFTVPDDIGDAYEAGDAATDAPGYDSADNDGLDDGGGDTDPAFDGLDIG